MKFLSYVEKAGRLILNEILDSASICNMVFMVITYLKLPLKLNSLDGSEFMICLLLQIPRYHIAGRC